MTVRSRYVLALAAVTCAAGGAVAVPATRAAFDRRDLRTALALARGVPAPPGATSSTECHGDGLVACWRVPAPVRETAATVAASLGAGGRAARTDCAEVRILVRGGSVPATECTVSVRVGGRLVTAFVDPAGTVATGGALVRLHAS